MNPQTATYGVRTAATTASGADTFTNYDLQRLVYRELTQAEAAMAGVTLADQWKVWTITQVDLDQASAPPPQATYQLTIQDGTLWEIEKVYINVILQAYECTCRLAR